jgi:hypothetical protein
LRERRRTQDGLSPEQAYNSLGPNVKVLLDQDFVASQRKIDWLLAVSSKGSLCWTSTGASVTNQVNFWQRPRLTLEDICPSIVRRQLRKGTLSTPHNQA